MQATVVKKGSEDDDRHWFEKITSLFDKNVRGVQFGIYGIAFCGLGIALRSVRPFKKFTSPNQIPNTFFENNIKLNGKVLNIDVTTKPLLMVDHYPILGSKFRSVGPLLSVELEGINISQNGISWLQTIAKGEKIEFTLLKKHHDSVSCIVMMEGKRDVAKHLVSLGFASVAPFDIELKSLKLFTKYYANLLKTEDRAERKGTGMWSTGQKHYNISDLLIKMLIMLRIRFNKIPLLSLKT